MTVVTNTSPLCYLILIGSVDVLPRLYREIHTSRTVLAELCDPGAPGAVRSWAAGPPVWLKQHADPVESDGSLASLHRGEQTAIRLAELLGADVLLLDDSAAREMAAQRKLKVSGLLAVLREASEAGLIDLHKAIDRLRQTTFRASPELLKSLLPRPSK